MDGIVSKSDNVELGKVNKSMLNGITSFDYEIIKAEETLQRETAVAVSFAANNLSRATIDVEKALKVLTSNAFDDLHSAYIAPGPYAGLDTMEQISTSSFAGAAYKHLVNLFEKMDNYSSPKFTDKIEFLVLFSSQHFLHL